MKNRTKKLLFFGFLFSFFLICSTISMQRENATIQTAKEDELSQTKINPKTSAIMTPIAIDDLGINDWVWASSQWWCLGSGTSLDPYIIENLIIDASYTVSCITIQNSHQYFIIRNCTLIKSGTAFSMSSIKLVAVSNGRIFNNNLSICGAGIFLEDCNEMRISNNILSFNWYGIWFEDINSNIRIEGNQIYNNTFDGINADIGIISTEYNIISNNVIENNGFDGIVGTTFNYNTFSGNTIHHNGQDGIDLTSSIANDILNNDISDNIEDGIYMIDSAYHTISDNTITKNGIGTFSGGIFIEADCPFTTITNNIINENNDWGVSIFDSNFCFISGNIASKNKELGIYTNNGDFQTITENTVKENQKWGILTYYGDYNFIGDNIVEHNDIWGITVSSNDYTTVSNNIIKNSDDGIYLYSSDISTIIGNYISDCTLNGILLDWWCYSNIITENRISKNENGITLSSEADYNSIYYNCLKTSNNLNALDYGYQNYWDINYYDDYTGKDLDGDGYGDIEYNITTSSKDYKPLMKCPFDQPQPPSPPIISPDGDDDDDDKDEEKDDQIIIWIIIGSVAGITITAMIIGYLAFKKKGDWFKTR